MNILFLHKNFPAQFKHILNELAKASGNKIFFITQNDTVQISGVNKIVYKIHERTDYPPHISPYAQAVLHAQAAANLAIQLKQSGFKPDVIYGHSWGQAMFMKDVFPDVPLICYFEWFYNAEGGDIGFDGKILNEIGRTKIRCKNANLLMDLTFCDVGITPTNWQKSQFPKEFHSKIKVIHDGIDTDICKPNENATFLGLTTKDEVITYATRGMEPYRGFPQFMQAVERLMKKRPNLHVIIAGEDRVFYGAQPQQGTYKEFVLDKLNFDMQRLYFTGTLPFDEYLKLLQISSVHVYLTYPFVLSWSILEAMACGCCVAASNTPPVLEVIKDNYNGLLFDFYNINQMVEKLEYVLDNREEVKTLKGNACKTILENYALKDLLPRHIDLVYKSIS
ncbi:MAG: glycosyltransferase [Candidatus Gastranaerophilales bacterium]|nr:glycosyltransferase [Candidatus Gastranaerophilales bacterium]